MRVDQAAVASHNLNFARLGHACQAGGQLGCDAGFVRSKFVQIELGCRKGDAQFVEMTNLVHHGSHMQQGF